MEEDVATNETNFEELPGVRAKRELSKQDSFDTVAATSEIEFISPSSGRMRSADNANYEDESESQISNELTVINNFEGNNNSAYDEMYSQNGSNSRQQSVETNEEEVDNETGENFLLEGNLKDENDKFKVPDKSEIEKLEIESFERELAIPPTPDDDVDSVQGAENPSKTGDGTASHGKPEVLSIHLINHFIVSYTIACV